MTCRYPMPYIEQLFLSVRNLHLMRVCFTRVCSLGEKDIKTVTTFALNNIEHYYILLN